MTKVTGMTKQNAYNIARAIRKSDLIKNKEDAYIAQPTLFKPFELNQPGTSSSSQTYINLIVLPNNALIQNKSIKSLAEYLYLTALQQHLTQDHVNVIYKAPYKIRVQGVGKNIWNKIAEAFPNHEQNGDNEIEFTTTVTKLATSEIGRLWLDKWRSINFEVIYGEHTSFYFDNKDNLGKYCRNLMISIQNYRKK